MIVCSRRKLFWLLAAATIFSGFSTSEATEVGDTMPKWVLIHDVHYVTDDEDLDGKISVRGCI